MQELIDETGTLGYEDAAVLLRDRKGEGGKDIGLGNEKAVNQLIAHHSIIFKPEEKQLWISTAPWQLGAYLCYDLDSVFLNLSESKPLYIVDREIQADTLFLNEGYCSFITYRQLLSVFQNAIKSGQALENEVAEVDAFIKSNPDYFHVYAILGQYFQMLDNYGEAMKYYNLALAKEVSSADERNDIEEHLKECTAE